MKKTINKTILAVLWSVVMHFTAIAKRRKKLPCSRHKRSNQRWQPSQAPCRHCILNWPVTLPHHIIWHHTIPYHTIYKPRKWVFLGTVPVLKIQRCNKTSLLQTLSDEAPPIGKIHPFSKIAVTFEPLMGFDALQDFESSWSLWYVEVSDPGFIWNY